MCQLMPSFTLKKEFKILILGDGNFSFSHSLLSQLNSTNFAAVKTILKGLFCLESPLELEELQEIAIHVTTTSFDSREQVLEKYGDSRAILEKIEKRFEANGTCKVLHNVNAWELKHHFGDSRFDLILWNHPHLGTEDFRLH